MTIVTKKKFQDWIKRQPDDRPVDMSHFWKSDRCGCAMVQFGQDGHIPFWKEDGRRCGAHNWADVHRATHAEFEDNLMISDIIQGGGFNKSKTFGALKKTLL
jgi:hypothetical protein